MTFSRPVDLLDYYKYLKGAHFIFIPIDEDLNTRTIGVLIDALSIGVKFIGPDLGMFKDINDSFGLGALSEDYIELEKIFSDLQKNITSNVDLFVRDTDVKRLIKQF